MSETEGITHIPAFSDDLRPGPMGVVDATEPVEPAADAALAEAEALADVIEAELAAIDHALERLEGRTYGTCEVCGATIADAALALDPTATRCEEHPLDMSSEATRLFPA